MHCDTILLASKLLPDAYSPPLSQAALAIAQGRILAIGTQKNILADFSTDSVRDLGCALIVPGFVNAHTHVAMTYLRGYADDMQLMPWLTEKIFPKEAQLTPEIVYTFSLLGFAEMLRCGTTSCMDMYLFEEEVFRAAYDCGIRLRAGEGVFFFPSVSSPNAEAALAKTLELAETYANTSRLSAVISPHSLYTTDPGILEACMDVAERYELPIHMHVAESSDETRQVVERYGMRPLPFCQHLGLFSHTLSLAHVVDTTDEDYALLASAKNCVCITNPTSNMKLASGICHLSRFATENIPTALGTDGAASNNSLNMVNAMNHCALIHKVWQNDPTCMDAQTVFAMATTGGARALALPDIGRLAPGMRADLAVFDLQAPNLCPCYNPVSHLVYAASGHEVILTMVDGTILYDHGTFTTFSYEELLRHIQTLLAKAS
ncbi:MAG: amidohydrolase [Desulfovibrio sp.]|nr:amidohydrolase [Desulfovibrio sp.]